MRVVLFVNVAHLRQRQIYRILCLALAVVIVPSGAELRLLAQTLSQAELAMRGFEVPAGFLVEVVAAEPMVQNPVAICLDEQQRLFVAETFRQGKGVEDNRQHMDWLDDDLAAKTVEDRRSYLRRRLSDDELTTYTRHSERIRQLVDDDGDRIYDRATVFAESFDELLSGTGADVRARNGNIYYACIPDLWLLRDEDGDGLADRRKSLHHGFGVRFAFRGHDLHGLTFGPDGRLYFSVGDRGYHVETADERTLAGPDRGAVFRCEPDGSNLEVFAYGLRNPQELAFDDYGNLFTCDNNSDFGDEARIVHVVEGGDSGWRMHYQYLADRGPWGREKLWHPHHKGQAAYIVPPVANFADGPSGLAHYPGIGLPNEYADHFFLSDFRGTPAVSGVRAFKLKPHGASFQLASDRKFMWRVLTTDLEFGNDGSLYVADWVNGWYGTGAGRVYRLFNPETVLHEIPQIAHAELESATTVQLLNLLRHDDKRVRQRAQFALAERDELESLLAFARSESRTIPRLHAIWGIGQIARRADVATETIGMLTTDTDREIRAQTARVLADFSQRRGAQQFLISLLEDMEPRVQMHAALSLARAGAEQAIPGLLRLLVHNNDRDPYVRHGAVMSLVGIGNVAALIGALDDNPHRSVRLGVLLALRRMHRPEIARLLQDDDAQVVLEAARAIHDEPIDAALSEVADLTISPHLRRENAVLDPLGRRVVNANFRLRRAAPLVSLAADRDVRPAVRAHALDALVDWETSSARDRVLGDYRPLSDHPNSTDLTTLVEKHLDALLDGPPEVTAAAVGLASQLTLKGLMPHLRSFLTDAETAPILRVAAVQAIAALEPVDALDLLQTAVDDSDLQVRVAALTALLEIDPSGALPILNRAMDRGVWVEQQQAIAVLASLASPEADSLLLEWLEKMSQGLVPAEIELDLAEAARSRMPPEMLDKMALVNAEQEGTNPLASYRMCLVGGNAERGREIFRERTSVSCLRCHKVGRKGGAVGPELTDIGRQKSRQYLLESIVAPDLHIAKGFETTVVLTDNGQVYSGIVQHEDDESLHLVVADGDPVYIAKDEIAEQTRGPSAMPVDLIQHLSQHDLRDLVEFLVQQTGSQENADLH